MREKKMSRFSTIAWGTFVILSLFLLYFPSALTARAAEEVKYISDPLTGETKTITNYTEVTNGMETIWSNKTGNGYYVVKKIESSNNKEVASVTISDRIKIEGDIHLILEDGSSFKAEKGIHVPVGSSLTIYGQEDDTGTLEAKTDNIYNAVIGGNRDESVGSIMINGGQVTAIDTTVSGNYGAGIGGGYNGVMEGSIGINGGKVTATSEFGAGIGSGLNRDMQGNIHISGGKVTASSGSGAGIGSGVSGSMGGDILISGGNIIASSEMSGAGIGSGNEGNMKGNITIDGGKVIATTQDGGAGIGSGYRGNIAKTGGISINGGEVTAATQGGGAGIGSGNYETMEGNISINGGKVTATSEFMGAGIGSGYEGDITGNITIDGGEVFAISKEYGAGIGSGNAGVITGSITLNGGTVNATSDNEGAGIGSGSEGNMEGNISIKGDRVTAASVYGAGIGSGGNGTMKGIVSISGGRVDAISTYGAGIGGDGEHFGVIQLTGGTIETSNLQGTAIGYTLNETEEEIEEELSSTITVNGKVIVSTKRGGIRGIINIEKEGVLQVIKNNMLLLKKETQMLNNGSIVNDGTIKNNGNMTNNGVFYNFDTFINNGVYTGNEPIPYLIEKLNLHSSQAEAMPGKQIELYTNMTARGQIPEIEWTVANAAAADTKLISGENGTAILEIGQEETAEALTVIVSCGNVSASAVVAVESVQPVSDKEISDTNTNANALVLNQSVILTWKNKTGGLRVHWAQIPEADGYDIFAAQSKKVSFGSKPAVTVTGSGSTTAVIKKVNGKKLKSKNNYKIKVRAYRMLNGKKKYIGSSMVFHVAGKKSDYTNAKKIRLTKKTVTVKKGRQTKIQAVVVKQKKNKILLPKRYVANLRYESSNKKIASVTRNGRIKAKNRGTCTIYVTAANGVRTQVKVMVK